MEAKSFTQSQSELIASIYEQNLEELKLYFLAYTHNKMDAEDMVQTLFLKIMNVDVIVGETARHLLFMTARRMIIDDLRHQYHVRQAELHLKNGMELASPATVYDQLERQQLRELEERRLKSMPKKRAAVYSLWREEKSMKEIAEAMNISIRTAETHVYHATCDMKEYIRKAI